MVDFCLTIEDKEERQTCAEAIVQTMSSFSNAEKERDDYWQILWDHLYIMSDFKLDVDYPYEVTCCKEEYMVSQHPVLENDHQQKPFYRHYGRNIERMIKALMALPEGEERMELAKATAFQMKRNYVAWNNATVADTKIFTDLFELSEGKIYLDESNCQLPDSNEILSQSVAQQNAGNASTKGGKRKMNVSRRRQRQRRK